jgi:ribosomal protein L37E
MLKAPPPRPLCNVCAQLPARQNGISARGFQRWHSLCNRCAKKKYTVNNKKPHCEQCNFLAQDECQLVLIKNTTLCQNCNSLRLKKSRRRTELTVDAMIINHDLIIR